jgi:hypothetical protein
MIKATIFSKIHNRSFTSTFMSKDKADNWVDEHPLIKKLDPKDYEIEVVELLPDGSKKPEEVPPITDPLEILREERNKILCATDWLFISDVSIPQKHRKAYAEYRTYLRDITKSKNDSNLSIEEFEHWLRRKHPEEFMDGGKGDQIIKRFKVYL